MLLATNDKPQKRRLYWIRKIAPELFRGKKRIQKRRLSRLPRPELGAPWQHVIAMSTGAMLLSEVPKYRD